MRKRGERSWSVDVDIGHDPRAGRRRQMWIAVNGTKRDAECKMAEIVHQLETSTIPESSSWAVGKYLKYWLDVFADANTRPRVGQCHRQIVERATGILSIAGGRVQAPLFFLRLQ